MPYAGQPESWEVLVEELGSFVTWVFIVEMGLKLLGMGCHAYWSDSWNTLDGVIVSLSIVEMLITVRSRTHHITTSPPCGCIHARPCMHLHHRLAHAFTGVARRHGRQHLLPAHVAVAAVAAVAQSVAGALQDRHRPDPPHTMLPPPVHVQCSVHMFRIIKMYRFRFPVRSCRVTPQYSVHWGRTVTQLHTVYEGPVHASLCTASAAPNCSPN